MCVSTKRLGCLHRLAHSAGFGLFVGVYQVLAHHSFYIGLHIRKTSIKDDDRLHCDMMSSVRRRAPVTASHRRTYSSLTIFFRLKPFDLFLFKPGKLLPGKSCSGPGNAFTSGSQGGAPLLREKTGVELPAVTRFVFTFSKEEVKPNPKKERPSFLVCQNTFC